MSRTFAGTLFFINRMRDNLKDCRKAFEEIREKITHKNKNGA